MKLVFALIGICLCSQYTPVPFRNQGLFIGTNLKLQIEVFYDMICPDSKEAFFEFQEVLAKLGQSRFTYVIHQYPLAYHKNAFTFSTAFRYLQEYVSKDAAYAFLEVAFKNQDSFTDRATINKSQAQVNEEILVLIKNNLKDYIIDLNQVRSAMLPKSEEDYLIRSEWKYGTSRNIAGTPIFLVNGVILDGAESYTTQDWINYIEAHSPK